METILFDQLQSFFNSAIIFYLDSLLSPFLNLSGPATFTVIVAIVSWVGVTLRISWLLPGETVLWARAARFLGGHLWLSFTGTGIMLFISMIAVSHSATRAWLPQYWDLVFHILQIKVDIFLYSLLTGLGTASLLWVWVGRKIEPGLQRFIEQHSKQMHDGLVDVRDIDKHIPAKLDFSPETYFEMAKQSDALFLGLNERGKPVLLPRNVFQKSNIQLAAPPGRGKGVCACVVQSQCIESYGDCVVVMDPKNDEWAPSVLANACKISGKPFQVLDLRQGKPAQFNPLLNTTSHELFELLVASLGLGSKGTEADYYRLGDRRIARRLSEQAEAGDTFVSLNAKARELSDGEDGDGFLKQFEELATLSCTQTKRGFNLQSVIEQGGCIYIIGSMRDETVMQMQKLVFVRLLQLIENRKRGGRHVSIFADEWKYLVSAPVINALGTVRDKGCNILIAHQSLGDLRQVGQDLDAEAAVNNVIDNTPIKWIYRPSSFEVADWASKQTGQIVVQQRTRTTRLNDAGAEVPELDKVSRDAHQQRYHSNIIMNLPDACALCIGLGPAQLAFARPIKVQKIDPPLFRANPIPAKLDAVALAVDPWSTAT